MKAIRVANFGPPEVMILADQPDPVPGPGQVLVDVRAAGVNPVDTYIRAGTYTAKPNLPYTPGGDGAGHVITVGSDVSTARLRDRVFFCGTISGNNSGGYASRALCSASQVHPLPDRLTFEQGAAIGVPYLTACRALVQRGQAKPGEWVLIHGATGGVGLAAAQHALEMNCQVIGTGGTDAGRDLLAKQGVRHILDHRKPDYMKDIAAITDGHGPDVILEMLANKNLVADLAVAAPRGRIVIIGNRGTVEIDPRATMARQLDIRGMAAFSATQEEFAAAWAIVEQGLSDGKLNPVVGQTLPLAEAPKAHHAIMDGPALGKIILLT